ncbi:hypothetical protein [Caulobacter sp. UNC279MFTsu5.1]|uniref:hypothetical protein n=1 Tax=Caulobacter sp. UNC279MFTsu5.1 TaxID=1502775 RepID=UPI0008DF15DA|nr:hypothetical protein [Caulobacter sp. UNC279MFTsu5.1]SFJ75271.1 hypothetical protein SAMN02799626_02499 [Caulobacter sp. UNC279MFTsu5.1]
MGMDIAVVTAFAALILVAGSLGGGVYETALIDRLWPDNPALVQPSRGGIDRKRFWIPAHFTFEALLGAALWTAWPRLDARQWLLAALAAHGAMRAWSFAYFIPRAFAFEKAGDFDADQHARAMAWVRASGWRLLLDLAAAVSLCLAIIALLAA